MKESESEKQHITCTPEILYLHKEDRTLVIPNITACAFICGKQWQ